jgi:hypothetical protein
MILCAGIIVGIPVWQLIAGGLGCSGCLVAKSCKQTSAAAPLLIKVDFANAVDTVVHGT